ncbi:MAG: serine/threonine-protein kinase, partial [Planctomycetota bacterium]
MKSPTMPDAGFVLENKWLLGETLGEGGFAKVFRAQNTSDGSEAAVKIIRPEDEGYTRETVARFRRESLVLARLDDPFVLKHIEHGESEDGLLYLVSELVTGRDLSEVLAQHQTLDESIVRHIVVQTLYGLRAAHREGLLHRDIKPENLRVYERGDDPWALKLLDFGIARDSTLEAAGKLTATGILVGTPRYMAPEQLRAAPLTPASDLYSLGIVAYEMLVGSQALQGGSLAAQLERVISSAALQLPESIEPALRHTIQSMLAVDPARRPQSAEAVLRTLTGPRAPQATAQAPENRERTKRRTLAIALVVTFATVVAFVSASKQSEETAPQPPTKAPLRAFAKGPLGKQPASADTGEDAPGIEVDATQPSLPVDPACAHLDPVPSGLVSTRMQGGDRLVYYVPAGYARQKEFP